MDNFVSLFGKNQMKLNLSFFKRLPAREKKITISTLFTLGRIVLTPIIVTAMILHYWGFAFALFLCAAITDMLDGIFARRWNEQTLLGMCLDPIADKLLILSCFFTLAFVQTPLFIIPKWFFIIVFIKEIILIAGAILLYAIKGHIEVRPLWVGKITTVVQMGFISWLFACYFFQWMPVKTYYTMLAIVLCLVIISLVQYTIMGVRWVSDI